MRIRSKPTFSLNNLPTDLLGNFKAPRASAELSASSLEYIACLKICTTCWLLSTFASAATIGLDQPFLTPYVLVISATAVLGDCVALATMSSIARLMPPAYGLAKAVSN